MKRVVDLAAGKNQTAAGIYTTGVSQSSLANSRGLFAYHEQTRAEFSVTFLEGDSSGWAKANFGDISLIDPGALAESASQRPANRASRAKFPPAARP